MIKPQNIKLIDNQISNVFHFLELSGSHSFLIGSSNIRNVLYSSDYDLNESLNLIETPSILDKLYKEFLNIFTKAYTNKDYYIVDFKCGYDDINKHPIRWNFADMKAGYKTINKKKYQFVDCLIQPSNIIKLDMIYLYMDNIFTDINILYSLHLVNNKNELAKIKSISKKSMINNLNMDIEKYTKEKNFFKVLKRYFNIMLLNGPIDKEIIKVLNSDKGILYKLICNLELVIIMLEQEFKPISFKIIKSNIQSNKQFGSNITTINIDKELLKLNTISSGSNNINSMINELKDIINSLKNKLNQSVKSYVFKLIS